MANAANTTSVASDTASTLKAANGARVGLSIYNASDKDLYVLFDNVASPPTVTASRFSNKIAAGGYFELPQTERGGVYAGAVYGITAAGPTGNILVTEYTA